MIVFILFIYEQLTCTYRKYRLKVNLYLKKTTRPTHTPCLFGVFTLYNFFISFLKLCLEVSIKVIWFIFEGFLLDNPKFNPLFGCDLWVIFHWIFSWHHLLFCLLVGFATLPLLAFAQILGRVQVRDERLGLASNNQEQLRGRNALITWPTSAVRATPSQPSLRLLLQFMVCFRFRAAPPRRCSLRLCYTHFSTLRALYGLGLCKHVVSFERGRRDKNIDFTFVYSGSFVNSTNPARSWRRAKRFLRCLAVMIERRTHWKLLISIDGSIFLRIRLGFLMQTKVFET